MKKTIGRIGLGFGMFLALASGMEAWAQKPVADPTTASTAPVPEPSVSVISASRPGEPRSGWDFSTIAKLPVQAGGRIKPFDSYARDSVLLITGRRTFQGWDPVDLMISWLAFPKEWSNREFIQVTRKDVKRQLGLDEERSRFTPEEILSESFLAEYAQELQSAQQGLSAQAAPIGKTSKQDARQEELKRLIEKISVYRAIVTGDAWPVVPAPAPNPWQTLAMSHPAPGAETGAPSEKSAVIRDRFLKLFGTYLKDDEKAFESASDTLVAEVHGAMSGWDSSLEKKIAAENFYNRSHPFQWAWIAYLIAAVLWTVLRVRNSVGAASGATASSGQGMGRVALGLTFFGFALHIFGMLIRSYIAGRPPVTNMYESIIWVSFGIVLFAIILWKIQKNEVLFSVACALGTVGLIVSDAAPAMIDPGIHPLVPVLRSNYWLTIHVLTITLSYAAFALSMGIGNVTLYHFIRQADRTQDGAKKIATLNQMSYRSLQFGVVLLAAGTILGGVWADYSWGRFWGWDPKEVWALIALLGYVIVLHARYAGWMRPFGYAAWTVLAFTLVLMAWYGVNFVLGVGLHSYGFSSGGQGSVGIFVLAQFAYVALATFRHRGLARA